MFAIALGVGYATESLTPVCTPMWFFYALFIIKIVYAVVPKTKISKTLQFVLCFVAVRLLTYYNIDTYNGISVLFNRDGKQTTFE